MLPHIKAALLIFLAFLLQTAVVPHLAIGRARPDLILVVVIIFGLTHGSSAGSGAGFGGGLLGDFLTVGNFGLGAVSKTLVGYLSGLVEKAILVESLPLMATAVFVASLIQSIIMAGLLFLLGEIVPLRSLFYSEILPSAVYTAIIGLFMFRPLSRLIAETVVGDRSVPDGRTW